MTDDPERDYGQQMLEELLSEVQRALSATDPLTRAQILAQQVQPYAGWALRWAVADAQKNGASWPSIGLAVGQQHTTIYRQFQGGGPLVTVRPHHTSGTRNDDYQDALRQAAKRVTGEAFPTQELQRSPLGQLYGPIQAMAETLRVVDSAEPLLRQVDHLLGAVATLESAGYPSRDIGTQEKAVWAALVDLRTAYERDKPFIEAAEEVARMARGDG
ncbi:hypothetical protein ACMATS_37815 (plasmid) [Streptoverticillium reticulum]|uniref:hypothetical protein n=1 Tax=Streptoverticillium reticulum TaxID=1433415 RepID=UPI0039BEF874